jgi:hypothetical protein
MSILGEILEVSLFQNRRTKLLRRAKKVANNRPKVKVTRGRYEIIEPASQLFHHRQPIAGSIKKEIGIDGSRVYIHTNTKKVSRQRIKFS